MNNILDVFIKIAQDESLMQELSEKETVEDAYAYCTSISGGYTIDDFKSFLYHLFKDNYKISEDDLEKIVGGSFSNKKLYLGLLSSIISFFPLINVKGLPPPGRVITVGRSILGVFKDSIFDTADVLKAHELLKEFNGIHDSLKWKLIIDGRYHEYGPDIFERDHDGHRGEPGYNKSMSDALKYTLSDECMNEKFFDDSLYLSLHTRACTGVEFRGIDHDLLDNYRKEQVCFGLDEGNSSKVGKIEFKNKKNSSWRSDLLFAYKKDDGCALDLAFGKLKQGEKSKIFHLSPIGLPNDIGQAVNMIFEDYYLKLDELKRNGYVAGSLINKDACREDKKLEIIIRICQNLDQLHAFRDANIRTVVFLVMQRMLIENGLTPTVFDNPNCIDMMSVEEIMVKLKEGQNKYRKIVRKSDRLRRST